MATNTFAARGGEEVGVESADIERDVRHQLARELHDRVAQTLTGMLVDVENFKSHEVGWDDVIKQLDTVQTSTRQVLSSLRQLLHDLRGDDPLEGSLTEALAKLVRRFGERTGIAAELDVRPGWPEDLTAPAALNLFRIVEEALANVRMHSGARNVVVMLEPTQDDHLVMWIQDDGRGTDTDSNRPLGLGTMGMKERALLLGGKVWIESKAGHGTTVRGLFPIEFVVEREANVTSELLIQGV